MLSVAPREPMFTINLELDAANPPDPVHWTCPGAVPRARLNVPKLCSTPPLSVKLLVVGNPTPSCAWSTPPVMLVTPV